MYDPVMTVLVSGSQCPAAQNKFELAFLALFLLALAEANPGPIPVFVDEENPRGFEGALDDI